MTTLVVLSICFFAASLIANYELWQWTNRLRENVSWYEVRFEERLECNWYMFHKLEKQVRRLNQRLVNLIDSPKTYLRARRIMGTLDLPVDEIIAEIELMNEMDELAEFIELTKTDA